MPTASCSTTRTACPRRRGAGGCYACSATTTPRCSTAACRNGGPRAGRCRASRRRSRRELVVDARAAGRFDGSAEETWPGRRRGHIPGSRNLPFDRVTDPQTRQVKDAETLRALFAEAGIPLDRPIVTSCGSGVTACAVAFALHLVGHPGAAVYDGSWSEWGLPDGPPIETGPAR